MSEELYQALIALLANLYNSDYPESTTGAVIGRPIYRGYENNYTMPENGKFVLVTVLEDQNMSLKSNPSFNTANSMNTYNMLVSTNCHVDFYGDNANDNAKTFSMLCQNGYANTFWQINNMPYATHLIKKPRNLSDLFGRDMYQERYLVELSIFNGLSKTITIPSFTEVQTNIHLANRKQET